MVTRNKTISATLIYYGKLHAIDEIKVEASVFNQAFTSIHGTINSWNVYCLVLQSLLYKASGILQYHGDSLF